MRGKISLIILLMIPMIGLAKNPFQDRLIVLNNEIIALQIKIKTSGRFDYLIWGKEVLALKEKIFLLRKNTSEDYLKYQTYGSEFSDLMYHVTELAQLKLDVLSSYKRTNSNFYLEKFNELNGIYTDLYEKILLSNW
jgi:hypothetical protein